MIRSDRSVTIALPKGRLLTPTVEFLKSVGLHHPGLNASDGDRRLIFNGRGTRAVVVRASDVPTYVEHGAADLGIVGKDMLLEQNRDVYEPLDLGYGHCRLIVAAPMGRPLDPHTARIRVATKYPRITEGHFSRKAMVVEIIKLSGAVELAPLVGLSDWIVDLITTGRTLRAHHLEERETIAECTARLIVNRASLKTKTDAVLRLMERFQKEVERRESTPVQR
jgi:ATP phosphoribosyltransferase